MSVMKCLLLGFGLSRSVSPERWNLLHGGNSREGFLCGNTPSEDSHTPQQFLKVPVQRVPDASLSVHKETCDVYKVSCIRP